MGKGVIFEYKIKNDECIDLQVSKEYDDVIRVSALDKDKKEIGYVNFCVIDESFYRKSWLNYICVDDEYSHKGIGSALLNVFEYLSVRLRCSYVDGKYYPKNSAAVEFYKKHEYSIIKDDYQQFLSKRLDEKKIEKEFKKHTNPEEVKDLT